MGYIYVSTEEQVAVVVAKIRRSGARATVWRRGLNYMVGSPDLDFDWFYHHIPTHQHFTPWCPWC